MGSPSSRSFSASLSPVTLRLVDLGASGTTTAGASEAVTFGASESSDRPMPRSASLAPPISAPIGSMSSRPGPRSPAAPPADRRQPRSSTVAAIGAAAGRDGLRRGRGMTSATRTALALPAAGDRPWARHRQGRVRQGSDRAEEHAPPQSHARHAGRSTLGQFATLSCRGTDRRLQIQVCTGCPGMIPVA